MKESQVYWILDNSPDDSALPVVRGSSVGQLPRVSGKDPERIRVDSVVETFIGQLPRVSGEDPERIRVDSVFETFISLCVCSFLVSKFSNFSLFQPSLFIQYSTEECSTVQVFIWCLDTIA